MPRKVPPPNIDTIGYLDIKPIQAVEEFLISKEQTKLSRPPRVADYISTDINVLYLQNEFEHNAMMTAQKELLKSKYRQSIKNEVRIKSLYKSSSKLAANLSNTNIFLIEYYDKKSEAIRAIKEQAKIQNELNAKIYKLKVANCELRQFKEQLLRTVDEYEQYETVIQEVVTNCSLYKDEKDLVDRCDALMLAHSEISNLTSQTLQQIEKQRQSFAAISKSAATRTLALLNELSMLTREYETAKNTYHALENRLREVQNVWQKQFLTKQTLMFGIDALYAVLCHRNHAPVLYEQSMEQKLDFLKEEIYIMRSVIKECTKIGKKKQPIRKRKSSLSPRQHQVAIKV